MQKSKFHTIYMLVYLSLFASCDIVKVKMLMRLNEETTIEGPERSKNDEIFTSHHTVLSKKDDKLYVRLHDLIGLEKEKFAQVQIPIIDESNIKDFIDLVLNNTLFGGDEYCSYNSEIKSQHKQQRRNLDFGSAMFANTIVELSAEYKPSAREDKQEQPPSINESSTTIISGGKFDKLLKYYVSNMKDNSSFDYEENVEERDPEILTTTDNLTQNTEADDNFGSHNNIAPNSSSLSLKSLKKSSIANNKEKKGSSIDLFNKIFEISPGFTDEQKISILKSLYNKKSYEILLCKYYTLEGEPSVLNPDLLNMSEEKKSKCKQRFTRVYEKKLEELKEKNERMQNLLKNRNIEDKGLHPSLLEVLVLLKIDGSCSPKRKISTSLIINNCRICVMISSSRKISLISENLLQKELAFLIIQRSYEECCCGVCELPIFCCYNLCTKQKYICYCKEDYPWFNDSCGCEIGDDCCKTECADIYETCRCCRIDCIEKSFNQSPCCYISALPCCYCPSMFGWTKL